MAISERYYLEYLRRRHGQLVGRCRFNNKTRTAMPTNRCRHCAYCHCVLTTENRTRDHVKALSSGGKDESENVVWCCGRCNSRKGNSQVKRMRIEYEAKMRAVVLRSLGRGVGTLPGLWRELLRRGFPCGRLVFLELMRRMDNDGEFR